MGIKGEGEKRLSRSTKRINTRAKHGGEANSIARRGQGRNSLAGSRGSAPCGVWGNAPTVPRATNSKKAANKGAGSEASLPVTLRSRRSAPKPLYPLLAHCRAKWARPHSRSTTPCPCFFPPNGYPNPKDTRKTSGINPLVFQSPEIFTSSAPPDESAGTSARSPQTRTSWGAVHAARDSAPTGRSKAECSAPATIG